MKEMFKFAFLGVLISTHTGASENPLTLGSSFKKEFVCSMQEGNCDKNFGDNVLLSHPNTDFLNDSTMPDIKKHALIPLNDYNPERYEFWTFSDFWSNYPLIAQFRKINSTSYTQGGYYVLDRSPTVLIRSGTSLAAIGVREAITNANFLNYQTQVRSLRQLESKTHAFVFNPQNILPHFFQGYLTSVDSYHEYFNERKNISEMEEIINRTWMTQAKKKELVQRFHARNDSGQVDDIFEGTNNCTNVDRTYNESAQSRYCKYLVFGAGQTFPVLKNIFLNQNFNLKVRARILKYEENSTINKFMHENKLTNNPLAHLNVRFTVRRKRAHPINYNLGGRTFTKTHDKISVHIPIIKPNELCLFPDAKLKNEFLCSRFRPEIVKDSSFTAIPDPRMGVMMFKVGRDDTIIRVDNTSGMLRDKLEAFYTKKEWLELDLQNLREKISALLPGAIQSCLDYRTKGRNYPIEYCNFESENIDEYSISSITIGSEVKGVHKLIYQLGEIDIRGTTGNPNSHL